MSVPMARVSESSRALESFPQGPIKGNGVQDKNFTVTGAKSVGNDIKVGELIDICLAEDRRRMSLYDRRLLRPALVPALARLARRFIRS